jgi:hypothetical protein
MPEIEQCAICSEEMNPDNEKFVVISKEFKSEPRRIAHPNCAKVGYRPVSIERD